MKSANKKKTKTMAVLTTKMNHRIDETTTMPAATTVKRNIKKMKSSQQFKCSVSMKRAKHVQYLFAIISHSSISKSAMNGPYLKRRLLFRI